MTNATQALPLEFFQLLRTEQTYKTYANAEKALRDACDACGIAGRVRYLIAATPEGRFAPVVVGNEFIPLAINARQSITVVS